MFFCKVSFVIEDLTISKVEIKTKLLLGELRTNN